MLPLVSKTAVPVKFWFMRAEPETSAVLPVPHFNVPPPMVMVPVPRLPPSVSNCRVPALSVVLPE